jgi:23S rRNA (uracil1939-C5)-methyltransferase
MQQSLEQKQDHLRESLAPWSSVLEPVRSVPEPARLHYRQRTKLSARCYGGRWEFGMEPRDDFIPIPLCPVHSTQINGCMQVLRRYLPDDAELPVRFVVQNGPLITLVVKARELRSAAWVTDEMTAELAALGAEGLHVNLHPAAGRILFVEKGWHCLWGKERIQDTRGLWHGPGTSSQSLPLLHEQALAETAAFFQLGSHSTVLDLHSGIGVSLREWTAARAAVLGVEFDGAAVACARVNAPHATVLRGPCAQRLPQVRAWLQDQSHALHAAYLQPPSAGLEEAVTTWLAREAGPQRIAYLSCSPVTLRRDLELLSAGGYRVERLLPFDFFPQTHHVDVLALMS